MNANVLNGQRFEDTQTLRWAGLADGSGVGMSYWKVDPYENKIREVKVLGPVCAGRHFETRDDAIAFMLDRAERDVRNSEAELAAAKRTLARLKRKYAEPTS